MLLTFLAATTGPVLAQDLEVPTWALSESEAADGDAVVGGRQVEDGRWDDAVGVVFAGSYVGCTGTLIGPKVVLTAGHCVGGYPITHVIVGSKDWNTNQGEVLEVDDVFEYPGSSGTYDVAVLTLTERSSYPPRAIAVDCILKDYLEDGAAAQIVGYGSTREDGSDSWNTALNEAPTVILDKNCSEESQNGYFTGCRSAAKPAGEIAAGGNGTDACYGDSGGPLYLKTDEGNFLVGVTSRAFQVPWTSPASTEASGCGPTR